MSIFNRKTKKKHIEQFSLNIADLLEVEMPQLKTVLNLAEISGIGFMQKPKGIYISTKYNPENHKIINRSHKTCFNLTGIEVFHKKEKVTIFLFTHACCIHIDQIVIISKTENVIALMSCTREVIIVP